MPGKSRVQATDQDEELISASMSLADLLEDLDALLPGLAALLSTRYPLSRISVRVYHPADDVLEIAAVWSLAPTEVRKGVRLPVRSTSFREVERRGGAIISAWSGEGASPLLDRVIHDEGNQSWVVVPLWRDRLLAGLLSISASEPDAFTTEDLPLFESLGAALADRLLSLARSPL